MGTAAREQSTYGGTPLVLVVFEAGDAGTFRYTSADTAITHNGNTYSPVAMVLGAMEQSDEDGSGSLEIGLSRTDPVSGLFIGGASPSPILVTVFRTHRDVSDALTTFVGEASSAAFRGAQVTLLCTGERQALNRRVPRISIQRTCPWMLGDDDCGVDLSAYRSPFGVVAVTNNPDGTQTLTVDNGIAQPNPGTYVAGVVDLDGERAYIVAQAAGLGTLCDVTLLTPLVGVAVSLTVNLAFGCDRTTGANGCGKFDNIARYGGFPGLANRNPFELGIK